MDDAGAIVGIVAHASFWPNDRFEFIRGASQALLNLANAMPLRNQGRYVTGPRGNSEVDPRVALGQAGRELDGDRGKWQAGRGRWISMLIRASCSLLICSASCPRQLTALIRQRRSKFRWRTRKNRNSRQHPDQGIAR